MVDSADHLLLVGRDGSVRRLEGDSAELARAVLAFFAAPHDEPQLIEHVERLAGAALGERRSVVGELFALLREVCAIELVTDAAPSRGINVVVAISGAIAASHAPALVGALLRRGHAVEVALTQAAARFVALETLAAITQREPHASMWPHAPHAPVPHVALARWADLVLVYPASATTIGRIANGDFSDLVAAIALTTRAPVVLVPSMNPAMLDAPAVQRNLDQLREDGFAIVHGVPSHEVADAPGTRELLGGAAPAPGEVVATIESLRRAGVLAEPRRRFDDAYRSGLVPWASDRCDADLAAALAEHAPPPRRLLDIGCGVGQVARHAAGAGYRVVATDVSEAALAMARTSHDAVVWLRDDICATALVGPFDVLVDRATLHALSPARARAWAAALHRLLVPGGIAIVKCHRDGVAGATTGWSATALAALLADFALVAARDAELPGLVDSTPIPSVLAVFRRL